MDTPVHPTPPPTWRDLPGAPPYGSPNEPAPAPPATEPEPEPEHGSRRRWWLAAAAGAAAVLALLLAAALRTDDTRGDDGTLLADEPGDSEATPATTAPIIVPAPESGPGDSGAASDPADTSEPIADVAEAVLPSVVEISRTDGLGSGVVYDATRGRIFTNAHVVGGANLVTVRLADGEERQGTVVRREVDLDLAIVEIDPSGLVAARFARADSLRVGEQAIAIGNPFGFEQTVTAGIVSGLDRELRVDGVVMRGLIQTDAPINQGNSGGALADIDGRVIGITTAIATRSGGNVGLGFAIPIDVALDLDPLSEAAQSAPRSDELDIPVDPEIFERFGLDPDDFWQRFGLDSGDLEGSVDPFDPSGATFDGFVDPIVHLDHVPSGFTVTGGTNQLEQRSGQIVGRQRIDLRSDTGVWQIVATISPDPLAALRDRADRTGALRRFVDGREIVIDGTGTTTRLTAIEDDVFIEIVGPTTGTEPHERLLDALVLTH